MAEAAEDLSLTRTDEEILEQMYLIYSVNEENYGVGINFVTEIVGLQKIIDVPDVPIFIKGVINLRGQVIPVIDIRLRFGLPEIDYSDRTVIIVMEHNGVQTGLIVDRVMEVLEISDENISSPPHGEETERDTLITGMGRHSDKVSFILDVETLLYSSKTEHELSD